MNIWDKLRYKTNHHKGIAATFVANEQMHLLAYDKSSALPQVTWQATLAEAGQPMAQQLQQLVKKKQLYKQQCHWVLMPEDYQLLLIELPKVEEAELPSALKWRVMELIDTDLEQSVIDYYAVPHPKHSNRASMAYVVVAPLPRLIEKTTMLEEAGLCPAVIDIPELAIRNVLMHMPGNEQGILFIGFFADQVLLMVCCGAEIYLVRRLVFAIANADLAAHKTRAKLQSTPAPAMMAFEEGMAMIGKEIERTKRYCEDQLEIAMPKQVMIWHDDMAEAIVQALQPLQASSLAIHSWFATPPANYTYEALMLLGVVLRRG